MAVFSQQAGENIVFKVELIIIDQLYNSCFSLNNNFSSRFHDQGVYSDMEREKVVVLNTRDFTVSKQMYVTSLLNTEA